jgi:hypothetical protein
VNPTLWTVVALGLKGGTSICALSIGVIISNVTNIAVHLLNKNFIVVKV